MEQQFVSVRAEPKLYPEAFERVVAEGSALVGVDLVGRLAPDRQRELSIVVLPDNNSRDSLAERAGAVLTEGPDSCNRRLECVVKNETWR